MDKPAFTFKERPYPQQGYCLIAKVHSIKYLCILAEMSGYPLFPPTFFCIPLARFAPRKRAYPILSYPARRAFIMDIYCTR